jgi:hypothetical protein
MSQSFNTRNFVAEIQAQESYEQTLEEGQYLGFYIPGAKVVLRRIEQMTSKTEPKLVACPVRRLFES